MEYKQAIIIRNDLKLPKGKLAAQVAHASTEAVLRSDKDKVKKWRQSGQMKIILKVTDLKDLREIHLDADHEKLTSALITDAGRTVIAPGTVTCLGIGPDKIEKIDKVVGNFEVVMKEAKTLHWSQQVAQRVIEDHGDKEKYTIAAGISPSGTVHIGNFREIITQELIARALKKLGKKVRFIYSWDDFDTFRKVPKDAPNKEILKKSLKKPLVKVPDVFDDEHESYARHKQILMENDLPRVGIKPEYIYQHKKYLNFDYAEGTKKAMQNTEKIRKILDKFRKEPLPEDWYPLSIYCEKCWKDTTTIKEYDGEDKVKYECECGHTNEIDFPRKGRYKLRWRIDWPMRWDYEGTDFESAGKDHGTQGGSFSTGDLIQKEVWRTKHPTHLTYNFIRIKGGDGKMSSSEGGVTTLRDVLKVYTPELARYLFAGARPSAEFAISFETEVLQIYDEFDRIERLYFEEDKTDNEKELVNAKEMYELSLPFLDKIPKEMPLQPGIRHLTNLVQIFPEDMDRVKDYYKDQIKTKFDEERLMQRAECALEWVQNHAPEEFRFSVQRKIPDEIKNEIKNEKEILLKLSKAINAQMTEDELKATFFEVCGDFNKKQFFKAAYKVLIGKEKGPKLATLVKEIGVEEVQNILNQLES